MCNLCCKKQILSTCLKMYISQKWEGSIYPKKNYNFRKCLFFLLQSGWLHKEVKNSPKMTLLKLKKRWFVLTHNSLDYYKSSEKNALKLGTLVLNSLCSVVPPDEKMFKETGNVPLGHPEFWHYLDSSSQPSACLIVTVYFISKVFCNSLFSQATGM